MPQVLATRKEETRLQKIELLTGHILQEYKEYDDTFESPLFDFIMKNFNVKRKKFFYVGDWTAILDLSIESIATHIFTKIYSKIQIKR